MKLTNLRELINIPSNENCDEIIKYLKNKFEEKAEEVIVVKNRENDDKSIIVGINTKLKDIDPIVLTGHIDTVQPHCNRIF